MKMIENCYTELNLLYYYQQEKYDSKRFSSQKYILRVCLKISLLRWLQVRQIESFSLWMITYSWGKYNQESMKKISGP